MAKRTGKRINADANVETSAEIAPDAVTDTPSIVDDGTEPPLRARVERDLGAGGALAQALSGYEDRPAQIAMARAVADALERDEHLIVEASTGTGKALDVDTPIPTPTGWKRMGDLVAGDLVFDEAGNPTRVVVAFDVMLNRDCYEVVFSDGSSLIADAEHEWASYTCADRKWAARPRGAIYTTKKFVTPARLIALDRLIAASQDGDILSESEAITLIGGHHWSAHQAARSMAPVTINRRTARYPRRAFLTAIRSRLARDLSEQSRTGRTYTLVTTERMAATLTVNTATRANHAIAVAGVLTLPDADLPVDPYFLGVWLGDGSSRCNQIVTADPDLIPEIEKAGYAVRKLASRPYLYAVDDENGKAISRWQPGMTGRLRALGLILNKQIPAIYLRASEEQRRALLAGLLDTDGTVNRNGAIEFTTTNSHLAQDTYELICSLGFRPTLRKGRAWMIGKDCGPKWMIGFTTDQQIFRLPRKVAMHKERLRNYSPERNGFRYVVAVNKVDSRPVRCIQVDAPSHLYLAGRAMIPTHNSLAYLLPIIHSGKVALISTANKNLQEQLFYKDIPFIQQHIQPFKAALVKGMGNYLCLDRLEEERAFQQIVKAPAFRIMEELIGDPDVWDGDFDVLPHALPADVRARLTTDSDGCAWRGCPHFADCYVRRMREQARDAQVIVVNHTLLLIDAAMGGWLLPERDVVVIDEAHHLEEEATRAFTVTVTPSRVTSLLAQRRLRANADAQHVIAATEADHALWAALQRAIRFDARGRQLLDEPIQEGLRLAAAIQDVADSLVTQRPPNQDDKEQQLYEKLIKRARSLVADLRIVFGERQPEQRVYYAEQVGGQGRRAAQWGASAAPLDVRDLLREQLFDKIPTIATSATIAVNGDFSFFRSRVGLESPHEVVLPLAFDYETHALLYVPRMRLEPAYGAASGAYLDELADEMRRLVEASDGRAFLLFSSQRALAEVYGRLANELEDAGYSLVAQGQNVGRPEMLRRFRELPRAVLFGLKSFWEGVDITGEALSLVVVDKLPFDPPDDPVNEARVQQMKDEGRNWFGEYTLPLAVLRLKQGIGRLLRTKEDRGVMAILDKRLHTKSYGRQVLAALPPAHRSDQIADVRAFFGAV